MQALIGLPQRQLTSSSSTSKTSVLLGGMTGYRILPENQTAVTRP